VPSCFETKCLINVDPITILTMSPVVAIHLVADGGRHYWIEKVDERYYPQLTDDDRLKALYGVLAYGGDKNFEIVRKDDNACFDAVLVSAGRFGVIYSVVMRALPQYALYERRRIHIWQDVKHQIKDLGGPLYTDNAVQPNSYVPSTPVVAPQRFLQKPGGTATCRSSRPRGCSRRRPPPGSPALERAAQRRGLARPHPRLDEARQSSLEEPLHLESDLVGQIASGGTAGSAQAHAPVLTVRQRRDGPGPRQAASPRLRRCLA
jgi:hypothetical protein